MKAIQHPNLDCHAHIAPDVTAEQLERLGDVLILAVTRTLDEAEATSPQSDPHVIWGCGVHPGLREARDSYDAGRFRELVSRFALIGEVGMDRRAGDITSQERTLRSILEVAAVEPILVSIHSAGCTRKVVDMLKATPHPGAILHWFLGTDAEVEEAASIGCFFSVNGAMTDDQVRRVPLSRLLPETDYPSAARRGGGTRPGDTAGLKKRVAILHGLSGEEVDYRWHRNLLAVATRSRALDRFPAPVADRLLAG